MNEKLNEMVVNHQNIISEKDKQLSEFKKQIESLQNTESELSKQIEEQKAKNNVSFYLKLQKSLKHPSFILFISLKLILFLSPPSFHRYSKFMN